jgi:hypothetical protein
MQDAKFQQKCQICGSTFRFGPHIFEGRLIRSYQLLVCRACWIDNWNGWSPEWDERLESHLAARGIPLPERNSKGCYPRGDH